MVRQEQVDQVADALVERGVRVTVDALGDALGRTQDLTVPLADWKRRRRYLGHLVVLDIPEDLERVLATVAKALAATDPFGGLKAPSAKAGEDGGLHPVKLPDQLWERLAAMAGDIVGLREQVAGLALAQGPSKPVPKARREGRKRGLAAAMGRMFWDRMMGHFAEAMRREGPMTAVELLATLDADALDMAEAAFERIDASLITEKVEERVRRGNYFRKTLDGRYEAL
ncbi:DNA-binding protein [Methylobacterium komagatae]|uniref:DNA-binding protein n=1 Tax=Methylobacterium komagatae TaxID=374425 RepID=A0ABW2BLZ4_9HYPH